MNLRDHKKARTRAALGDAAVLLFLERGYECTTIEEIAAASGVSRRTFFRYFPTKEAAFFAMHDARFDAFVAAVDSTRAQAGAWPALHDALLAVARAYAADRRGSLAWHAVLAAVPALRAQELANEERWEAKFRAVFVEDGCGDFEAAVRAGALMGVLRAALAEWVAGDARADLTVLGRRAFDWLAVAFQPALAS